MFVHALHDRAVNFIFYRKLKTKGFDSMHFQLILVGVTKPFSAVKIMFPILGSQSAYPKELEKG